MDGVAKRCFKCGELKRIDEFYRHSKMKDGRLNKCKQCTKKDTRTNYAAHRRAYSEYGHKRQQSQERRRNQLMYQRRYRQKHPEKVKARTAVAAAVRSGRIVRPKKCEGCNRRRPVQAHHADHTRPLDVKWLCFECHREREHSQKVTARDYA